MEEVTNLASMKGTPLYRLIKFQTLMGLLIGLCCGLAYSLGGLVIDALVSLGALSAAEMDTPGLSVGALLAFGALVGMPAIGLLFGLALGLVEVILYKLFKRLFVRFKLELSALFDSDTNE